MEMNEQIRAALDAVREGINIIDTQGRIVFANRAYRDFLAQEMGGQLGPVEGRLLRELRPGARLPQVVAAGQEVLHAPRMERQDKTYFVNMYPITGAGGEIIGGISVVTFLKDAYDFQSELERFEKHSKQVLRRVNKANSARYTFDSIVAVGEKAQAVKALAQKAAGTDATVLLASESGTGKELYAQAIHNASARKNELFVAINCANFNANTLESELFGYVEGAFTGAKRGGKIGLFEAANGGTLFLDEVSEMDYSLQAKMLRAIQEGRIRPVGGVDEIEVDVRLISASNADLADYIRQGKFRQDLYYRLSTFQIHIPPLRERREDIPALAEVVLQELSQKLKRPVTITREALNCLSSHDWPGNVRELRNVLEFSAYLSDSGSIDRDSLPQHLSRPGGVQQEISLAQRVRSFEREEIRKLLLKNGSDLAGKRKTAQQLGISLATLYNKLGE